MRFHVRARLGILASSLRTVLVKGRGLPFVQRYVAGTVFIGLGAVAATASGTRVNASSTG